VREKNKEKNFPSRKICEFEKLFGDKIYCPKYAESIEIDDLL